MSYVCHSYTTYTSLRHICVIRLSPFLQVEEDETIHTAFIFFGTSVRIDNQNCINSYEKNIFGESEKKNRFLHDITTVCSVFFVFLLKSIQFLRRVTTLHTQNEIIKKT